MNVFVKKKISSILFTFIFAFCSIIFSMLFAILFTVSSNAWDNHTEITYLALKDEVAIANIDVATESLNSFLEKEQAHLPIILEEVENWAKINVPNYPPTPEDIKFKFKFNTNRPHSQLVKEFLYGIRVNPQLTFPLFMQLTADRSHSNGPTISSKEISIIPVEDLQFERVNEGELLPALDIISTASNEPDYGMDVGLFNESNTDFSKRYGLGQQPFGNSKLLYGDQAPFHMGFFHQNWIVNLAAAKYTQHSLVEYRIKLFATLANFAFERRHFYWGLRFWGWALHYLQDLAQPYHASLLPGVSALKILALNLFNLSQKIADQITIISNHHLILENYLFHALKKYSLAHEFNHPLLHALASNSNSNSNRNRNRNSDEQKFQQISFLNWARQIISKEAYEKGNAVDLVIRTAFPSKYVKDPNYSFSVSEPAFDTQKFLEKNYPQKECEVEKILIERMQAVGEITRSLVKEIILKQLSMHHAISTNQ
ncbi:MAG: hypothetical protein HQK53_10595 [Oligoflexia bacterium]|nr:hypothetical protein [Oligoflexia bacterium]